MSLSSSFLHIFRLSIALSFLVKNIRTHIHLPYAPYLLLILGLVIRESQPSSSALRFSSFSYLRAKPESHALEVVLHAALGVGRQIAVSHPLVEYLALLVRDREELDEGGLGGELDGDDHVADRREDRRGEHSQMRPAHIRMNASDGSGNNQRETSRVRGAARWDDGR